jgi:hypothetical protein
MVMNTLLDSAMMPLLSRTLGDCYRYMAFDMFIGLQCTVIVAYQG